MRGDAAAAGRPSVPGQGTKRRRVTKSGADEVLEEEDAQEAEEEYILLTKSSPRALELSSAAPLASKR